MLHTGYEKEYYPLPGHPITDDELADLEPHRGENDEYATLGANIFTHLGVGAIAVWRSVAARLFRVREMEHAWNCDPLTSSKMRFWVRRG